MRGERDAAARPVMIKHRLDENNEAVELEAQQGGAAWQEVVSK